ncbi:LrgB family protein [Paraburkholderia sp. JHI869]|uniref:LrgB family protein n=1 Tax=Paraburkholderia sp. JHI869 TaxID=3112959 RepID=UPI00317FB4FF
MASVAVHVFAREVSGYCPRGFAIGVASHGIGTARAFQISEEAGAFAGLGMAMNGTMSALVLPFVLPMVIAHVA